MTAEVRLLYIDDVVPERRLGAGYPRAQSLLRLLASSGFAVTLFPWRQGKADRAAVTGLNQWGVHVVQYAGRPREVLAEFCAAELSRFDAVWISRPRNFQQVLPIVQARGFRQPVIYDAEAIVSLREIARRDVTGEPMDNLERHGLLESEFAMMRAADAVVSVSVPEREAIARACGKPTFLMGHVEAVTSTLRGFAQRAGLLFVGSFLPKNCPNTDSMLYFTREVLPLVRQRVDCKLSVVGYRSEALRIRDPAVAVRGSLDSLTDVYDSARVMVVPTRFAAGVPGKLAEAFAHGLPCVVTPIIANQVPFREPPVLTGATPAEFASQVVSLYTDEDRWRRVRQLGEEYARAYYDESVLRAEIDALRSWITTR